jgi:26S proteasome regulatory subunit N10
MCLSMRANKAQRPRIVAFVGTAVRWKDPRGLVRLGKKLRKAGCAVDIVSFGCVSLSAWRAPPLSGRARSHLG